MSGSDLQVASLAVIPMSLAFVYAEALRGMGHTASTDAIRVLLVPLVALVGTLILGNAAGVSGALAAFVAGAAVAWGYGAASWRYLHEKANPKGSFGERHGLRWRELLARGFPLLVASLGTLLVTWVPLLALTVSDDPGSAGLFVVASRIAALSTLFLVSVNAAAAPVFARLYSSGQTGELEQLATSLARRLLAIALFVCFGMIVFAEPLLLLFGAEFQAAVPALRILALAQLINVGAGSVGYLLMMSGREWGLAGATTLAVVVGVVTTIVLVSAMGLVGASIGAAAFLATLNIAASLVVYPRSESRSTG